MLEAAAKKAGLLQINLGFRGVYSLSLHSVHLDGEGLFGWSWVGDTFSAIGHEGSTKNGV